MERLPDNTKNRLFTPSWTATVRLVHPWADKERKKETGSWVLSGRSGVRHPLSPVIMLGLRNPRKKERYCCELGVFRF